MKKLENFVLEYRTKKAPDFNKVDGKGPQEDQNSRNGVEWSLNEPSDDDASDDIDLDSEENTKSLKRLIAKFDAEQPFFIQGKAGWGKTSIIKKLAKKYKKEVVTVYLDKAEATDLGGIPVAAKDKTTVAKVINALGKEEEKQFARQLHAIPEWAWLMLTNKDKEFLLFFDEMNQAAPDVMNALMPIVLENEICGIKFNNFFVGAAGNFEEENGAISELSGPLKSRFKPLIIWDAEDEQSWKQAFKHLHSKWDQQIGKNLVDKFEDAAMCFVNPREIEHKILVFIKKLKDKGVGKRYDAEFYLDYLNDLTKEELSRTEGKQIEQLANTIYDYVNGNLDNTNKENKTGRRGKDSQMVPESIKTTIESGMKEGYISVTMGDGKKVRFGVSKENINDLVESDECNAEMIERTIRKFENDGIKWKYEKNQDWKKIGLEDPQDDKWGLTITSKTKVEFAKPERKNKKD